MTSKLKEILDSGIKIPIHEGDNVLYLGASHGITSVIISEMVGVNGFVFCVEISKDSMKNLLKICELRENMAPLLFDASLPEKYKDKVFKVNVIYQDIAQKNQAEILKKNAVLFLKEKGYVILIVKTQSIDAVKEPSQVLEELKKELGWMEIENVIDLNKTHAKHYAVIGRRKEKNKKN